MSNDTDVFALILHYIFLFFDKGINELWLKSGSGRQTRILPMHIMHRNIGHGMCLENLPLHVLRGCDVTSKIGTKYGALNVKAIDYLKTFGPSKNNCHKEAKKAESYLVKALRPSSVCTTNNELRNESYLDKSSSLIELLPTSSSIFGHIFQSHFIIDQYLNLMKATEKSNVQEFGWIEADDVLYQTNAYHQYLATCCQIWMQEKVFPMLPVFLCRYKMH